MRTRINNNLVCRVTTTNKCFFNKTIELPKKEKKKVPHVKCFGKLVPVSVNQALNLVKTTEIYMI